LNETLETSGETLVLCQGNEELFTDPEYFKKYFDDFQKAGCKAREIIEEKPGTKEYRDKYNSADRQILLSPPIKDKNITHIDKIIYGNKVAIIEYERLLTYVIEDNMNADNERIIFNILWNTLKKKSWAD
jgi:hypothetical protein